MPHDRSSEAWRATRRLSRVGLPVAVGWVLLAGLSAAGQTECAVSSAEELTTSAYSLFGPGGVPGTDRMGTSRGATAVLNTILDQRRDIAPALLKMLGGYLERPSGLECVVQSQHFRIHFTLSGVDRPAGWPDSAYLRETSLACETAWQCYHRELGWPESPSDRGAGGDTRVDVYLRDLGARVFGYSLHEEIPGERGCAGFLVIDNDFASDPTLSSSDALRVTIAHEYHHLVQFGFGYAPEITWFMEQCATMFEGRVYPAITDHDRYLDSYSAYSYLPLDLANGAFEYGAWLWPQFLAERRGDAILINCWRAWRDGAETMIDALDTALARYGGLDAAFREWTEWNLFLGPRDDGAHYADGSRHDCAIVTEAIVDQYPLDALAPALLHRPGRLGVSYVELRPQFRSADNHLSLSLGVEDPSAGGFLLVRRGADTEIAPVPFAEGAFTCEIQRWDEVTGAWIAVSGGHRAARPFAYELSAVTFFSPASVDDEWRWSGGLQLDASPNPFDRHAVLAFRLEERAPVRLRVLDSAGRVVATLLDNECTPGGHAVRWSGPDRLTGVSSGVYFAEIRTPAERRRVRLVHVR